jgi:hypothetical protein
MKRPNFWVLNSDGNKLYSVHASAAAKMIEASQAMLAPCGRALQLISIGKLAPDGLAGRTHTSRGGLLAAIGRSQQYTTANGRGQVDGFKTIYPEDRDVFRSAILDCVTVS